MKNLRYGAVVFACMASLAGVEKNVAVAAETFVIAGSPSLRQPLEALGRAFEATHPEIGVRLYLDTGLELRQTVAAMENSMIGQYFIGKGPIHLVAPGGDELINRLQARYYVLPGTKRTYAVEQLVLVVPEQLVEAPASFNELDGGKVKRLAVADSARTVLGQQTKDLLQSLGFQGRLDVATDARGVLDHILSGQADAGIIFGHDAVQEQERVRVVAVAETGYAPTVHSMAMERYCPNRKICDEFLTFIQSAEAHKIVKRLGYAAPVKNK